MFVGLLMTDNGPHPPEKLSALTVQRFLEGFAEKAPAAVYAEVERFRGQADRLMTEFHRIVQTDERSALEEQGPDRIAEPMDLDGVVNQAVDEVLKLALQSRDAILTDVTGTPRPDWPSLLEYFRLPQTRQFLTETLHREFHQNVLIERSWASHDADTPKHPNLSWQEPDHPACKAFRAVARDGHALLFQPHPDDADKVPGQDVVRLSPLDEHGGREMVEKIVSLHQPGPK
jgi:hypothetical protein